MAQPLCIYHKNCADGFASAWVVRNYYGENVDFHAAAYGDPPPDVAGRDVLIVDFSYPVETMRGMGAICQSMLVLDHHKTAEAALSEFFQLDPNSNADGLYGNAAKAKINVLFDMNRSGAGITWDFFYPDRKRPLLIDMVEDRDLWRFKIFGSKEMHAFLMALPYEFDVWTAVVNHTKNEREHAMKAGEAIMRRQTMDIRRLIEDNAYRINLSGHDVPVLNCPHSWASDAGHFMCEGEEFSVTYSDTPSEGEPLNFRRKFSLRSDGKFDVSEIAAGYPGGGGHAAAAGFEVHASHPLVLFGKDK